MIKNKKIFDMQVSEECSVCGTRNCVFKTDLGIVCKRCYYVQKGFNREYLDKCIKLDRLLQNLSYSLKENEQDIKITQEEIREIESGERLAFLKSNLSKLNDLKEANTKKSSEFEEERKKLYEKLLNEVKEK